MPLFVALQYVREIIYGSACIKDLSMPIKATQLRRNLYQLLDKVLRDGQPLEIERAGQILQIIPAKKRCKFEMLEDRKAINGDPESLLGLDWSEYWSEPSNVKATKNRKRETKK